MFVDDCLNPLLLAFGLFVRYTSVFDADVSVVTSFEVVEIANVNCSLGSYGVSIFSNSHSLN